MKTYRKIPVKVEAVQITPNTMLEVQDWLHAVVTEHTLPGPGRGTTQGVWVRTLHMEFGAPWGSWIVMGSTRQPYVVLRDDFVDLYEEVTDQ